MIIHSITIHRLGNIEHFGTTFTSAVNILKNRETSELSLAIQIILHHTSVSPLSFYRIGGDTEITATVSIKDKFYTVTARYDTVQKEFRLFAWDKEGYDVTAEYLYLSCHCEDQNQADIFNGNESTHHLTLCHYINDEFLPPKRKPDDYCQNKTFRCFLYHFIKNFQPEIIRHGKPCELILKKNGIFDVKNPNDDRHPIFLSESEQVMFRYLCFLNTAEFWCSFEKLRNLHSVKKPLLIEHFLERLDESIDTQQLLIRTHKLNRQTIILSI